MKSYHAVLQGDLADESGVKFHSFVFFSDLLVPVFAEKVFVGGVPKCEKENCNGVVKPGQSVSVLMPVALFAMHCIL